MTRVLARCHPLIVTDERGSQLRDFLRATSIPVWVEGCCTERFRRVLVAIDPYAHADDMHRLLELAQLLAIVSDAELFALHAWDAPGEQLLLHHGSAECARRYVANEREHAAARFAAHLSGCAPAIDDAHRLCVRGEPRRAILRAACQRDVDAVVVGMSHRSRVARTLLGCTAVWLASTLHCHVLVQPSGESAGQCKALPRALALRRAA